MKATLHWIKKLLQVSFVPGEIRPGKSSPETKKPKNHRIYDTDSWWMTGIRLLVFGHIKFLEVVHAVGLRDVRKVMMS